MINLARLRTLDLEAPPAPGRPSYISAASGLVCRKGFVYVIADDEHHLAIFRADDEAAGKLIELIPGELPAEHKARKKEKPDFEALTFLPPFGPYRHGALLASGSGSRSNRRRGALVGVGADGTLTGAPSLVDLSFLMTPLEAEFGKINLEGLAVAGTELIVCQRGNKGEKRNALIRFDLPPVLEAFTSGRTAPLAPRSLHDYDLGAVKNVPLTFTDATVLPSGEIVFSAVAEDTDDATKDGGCAGAAIGLIGADSALKWVTRTDGPRKIEGIDARIVDDTLVLLLVTDADNIEIASGLFMAEIEL